MNQEEPTISSYRNNWELFATEILGVRLDSKQMEILKATQTSRRVAVRSGHARGKDYVAAVASLCFLYTRYPSKVINTAPTARQVESIMMTEINKIRNNARRPLGGVAMATKIKFPDDPDWFLEGFKAADKDIEAWSGFHSPNILVVATEASGLESETFVAIEGLLTGDSTLLEIGNPNRTTGDFYNSFRSPLYKPFVLSCLDAPNVIAKKVIIPGQVDYVWVKERINTWCIEISKDEMNDAFLDFEFEGKCYRPNDLFLVKVLGEFPRESSDQLIPLSWVEQAQELWLKIEKDEHKEPLRLGVDIAGMGRDNSVYVPRRRRFVEMPMVFRNPAKRQTIHMENAGRIKNILAEYQAKAFIDTIGEGAGVVSRLEEQSVKGVISVKYSEAAKRGKVKLTDLSGERTFHKMRSYCWWAVRDALDPSRPEDERLALPPCPELIEDLTCPTFVVRSDGDFFVEKKEDFSKRLGRSPDWGDALANTYYPDIDTNWASMWDSEVSESKFYKVGQR